MANSKANYLDKRLFTDEEEHVPTRDGFGHGLVAAGEINANVVGLCADLTESTRMHWFEEKFPERFFQVGVAEQNLATVAAGLATAGKVPFIASYATFSPGRNWEQIRTTAAYNDANVKITGHHAGIATGPDGATHEAIEDVSIMRAIPNMQVIVPIDAVEAKKATLAAAQIVGPVYLRFTREKTAVITSQSAPFTPGKALELWRSKKTPQVAIIGCGPILYQGLLAARKLEKEKGIGSVVINSHTVKPLDIKTIVNAAKKYGAIVTVEEHQVLGGLGGAIAEALALKQPTPIEFIGMQDTFGESGDYAHLIPRYKMDPNSIIKAVQKVIKRK